MGVLINVSFDQLVTGKKIRELRTACKMTQKELAEKIGLTQQAINLIEHDKRRIDIKLYAKIVDVLDPDHKELVYIPSLPDDLNEEWIKLQNMRQQTTDKSSEIVTKILDTLKNIIISNDKADIFTHIPEEDLLYYFWNLNEEGQKKTIEYAGDLTENPKYRKDTE